MIDCYTNKKMSLINTGKELGISPYSVSKVLKENNVHIRTDREQALKYTVNEDFFETIDTEKKAYWLGFMYADGYIAQKRKHTNKKVGLSISTKDMERLEAFKSDLEFTGPIRIYKSKGGYKAGTEYGRVLISSEKMADDLIRHGCVESKTHKLVFPSEDIVPKELRYHFIRGYLDGDGSIVYGPLGIKTCGISFTGTKEFLTELKAVLGKSSLALDKRYKDRKDNIYSLNIGGVMQVIEICYRLYGHATTHMERKYNNYRKIVNEYFEQSRVG